MRAFTMTTRTMTTRTMTTRTMPARLLSFGLLSFGLLSFAACEGGEDELTDEERCEEAANCIYEGGEARCDDGFAWADEDNADNFDCDDLCDAANFCERVDGVAGCQDGYEWDAGGAEGLFCIEALPTVPVLGDGGHTIDDVVLEVMADASDGLSGPRDLEFHPGRESELWLVNTQDDSTTVITNFGTDDAMARRYNSLGSSHFLAHPSAMAFSDNGNWVSAQETDDLTQGPESQGGTPPDFMGPSLWPSDLSFFDAGHGSHYDMLHNSPNAVGAAWETGNKFWIYDGYHNAITSYDFREDHGPGGADHSDGVIRRCVDGEMGYFPEVSSHLAYDVGTGLLYAADTATNAIMVLDTTTGKVGGGIAPNYDCSFSGQCASMNHIEFVSLEMLIDGDEVGNMFKPSGIEVHEGLIYVSDAGTGHIFAFELDGTLVDYLDTGVGDNGLSGMDFDADGNIVVVDVAGSRLLRISPLAE